MRRSWVVAFSLATLTVTCAGLDATAIGQERDSRPDPGGATLAARLAEELRTLALLAPEESAAMLAAYRVRTRSEAEADLLLADAEAAVFLADTGDLLLLTREDRRGDSSVWARLSEPGLGVRAPWEATDQLGVFTLAGFVAAVDAVYPGLRDGQWGPYLFKFPSARVAPVGGTAAPAAPTASGASAVVLNETFETDPWSRWQRQDSSSGQYTWERTTCDRYGGSYAADAVRGGSAASGLACDASYPHSTWTAMTDAQCENLVGASEAWLDLWAKMASESGGDWLGVYYEGADQTLYGYGFSGAYSTWRHLIFNLRRWYKLGDLTQNSCNRLTLYFESNSSNAPGYGARVDDITIRTGPLSGLSCAPTATPASGPAPLAVAFAANTSGGSGAETFYWNFDDGGTSTQRDPSHTFSAPGEYSVYFRATDGDHRCYADVLVTVTGGSGTAPQAGRYEGTTSQGKPIGFTVDASGKITTYSYGFACGPTSGETTVTYTTGGCAISNGTFTCGSTGCSSNQIKMQFGGTFSTATAASGWMKIYVWPFGVSSCCTNESLSWSASLSGGSALAATASGTPTSGTAPLAVTFTGGATGGTPPYTYSWNFGDGSAASTQQNPSHTYSTAGSYTATLTVQDAASGTATATVAISVGAPPSQQYVYLIGSVAHLPGVGSTLWRTDVGAVYRGGAAGAAMSAPVDVTLAYKTDSGVQTQTRTLQPGDGVEWSNILESVFGMSASAKSSGCLAVVSPEPLYVASRTYNQTSQGTFGQYYPALTQEDALTAGQVGVLPQLKKISSSRTNVGLVNLGSAAAMVEIRLHAGGVQVGSTKNVTVEAGAWKQVNDIFVDVGAGERAVAYATVEVKTPGGQVWAYASVVDATTGDPTTFPVLVH